jgi:C4-dicarboxylate-specific signal transduction histidine kinase
MGGARVGRHLFVTAASESATRAGVRVANGEESVRLVLRELLENAWRGADAPRGRIEVGAARVKGTPALYVRHNGPGFDAEFATQLFRPFQRTAVLAAEGGVGLGLALAHTAVRRMAGRIWVEANPGRGATFWVIPTYR